MHHDANARSAASPVPGKVVRWLLRSVGPVLALASCADFGGKDAVLRTAADETPCPREQLTIVSQPGQGEPGEYVLEGCGQRLTYRVTLSPRQVLLLSRVSTTPAAAPP